MPASEEQGFTLLELLFVLILISVFSIYVSARFSADPFLERDFYTEVVTGLLYAQETAMRSGCNTQFLIDTSHYELNLDSNCINGLAAAFDTPILKPFTDTPYSNHAFPSSITSITSEQVIFFPQGWACHDDGNSLSTLTIDMVGQTNRTIEIFCGTGYVREG